MKKQTTITLAFKNVSLSLFNCRQLNKWPNAYVDPVLGNGTRGGNHRASSSVLLVYDMHDVLYYVMLCSSPSSATRLHPMLVVITTMWSSTKLWKLAQPDFTHCWLAVGDIGLRRLTILCHSTRFCENLI